MLLSSPSISSVFIATQGNQLATVDVSNPIKPTFVVTQTDTALLQFDFVERDAYIYRATGSQGLQIIDLYDPIQPVIYPDVISGQAVDVALEQSYLYVAQGQAGVSTFDVTTPLTPNKVAHYQPSDLWVSQVAATGNHIYLSGFTKAIVRQEHDNHYQLRIVDIANPLTPIDINTYALPYWVWDIVAIEPYIYLVDNQGALRILDVSTPNQLIEIGVYHLPNQAYQIALDNLISPQYAYIAAGVDGLRVIDISTPTQPTEVAFYDTADEVWQVTAADGKVYLTDNTGGLYILRLTDPLLPSPPSPEKSSLPDANDISPLMSSISPYELAALPPDDITRNNYLIQHDILSPDEAKSRWYASINLVPIEPLTPNTPDVLLEITPGGHGFVHYLLYRAMPENKWALWGHIQYVSAYGSAQHRLVVNNQDDIWLVTSRFAGGGGSSGSALFEERWYWINEPEPKLTLQFSKTGYTNLLYSAYAKTFTTTVETSSSRSGEFLLSINSEATYETLNDEIQDNEAITLFDTQGEILYAWQPEQKLFTYVPNQSNLSPKQLAGIGDLSGPYIAGILENNFTTLLEQWFSGDAEFRRWLALYLEVDVLDADKEWLGDYSGASKRPEYKFMLAIIEDTK